MESTYVGFALFLYLELFCLYDSFSFLSNFYLVTFLSFIWNIIFERTKTWQNLCLSLSIANYADYFSLRFVFSVRLQMLSNIYKRLFNSNHLLKPNTFNVIFWNEVTHMDIPAMVVHNHPSSWYYNRQFSCYIWNMLISDPSFATAGRSSLLVGPLESYYKEWPRL